MLSAGLGFLLLLLLSACTGDISTQPKSQTVDAGQTASFTVGVTVPDGVVVSYQWLRNGQTIAGATSSTYRLIAQSADNGARFSVTVCGKGNCKTSDSATLTVNQPATSISVLAGQTGGIGNLGGSLGSNRLGTAAGTAVDNAGNLYIADSFNNAILKITPAGVSSVFAGSNTVTGSGSSDGTGRAAQFWSPSGIAIDSSGNLYVADSANNTIRKITPAAAVSTLAGTAGMAGSADGSGAAARFNQPGGISTDSAGNIYVADTFNNTIRKITPSGVVSTVAGTAGVIGYADGAGNAALFNSPHGLSVDGAGNIYVADTSNQLIRKISPGGIVSSYAGTPLTAGSNDGLASLARFNQPQGVLVLGSDVYVADTDNRTLRRITASLIVSTVAGIAGVSGSNDGLGLLATFGAPTSLSANASGNIFVADQPSSTVRKVTALGMVSTVAGKAPQLGSTDGNGASASFRMQASEITNLAVPQLASDSSGNIYVSDTFNNTIRKITPAGVVTTIAGTPGIAGSADGTGAAASFNGPVGTAVDSSGNIYVADTGNSTIRKISANGIVTTVAGTAGNSGSDDGTGTAASFFQPQGVALDGAGNIYVADTFNSTIRKITPAGVVTTLAGSAGNLGSDDGTGAAASFFQPQGITADNAGNVYVADTFNNTIRKITASGIVTTVAGAAGTCGTADGNGSSARFCVPVAIAVDAAGNLYVADMFNAAVRKITPAGVVSTLVGGNGIEGVVTGNLPNASLGFVGGMAVSADGGTLYTVSENALIKIIPGQSRPTPPVTPCKPPCKKPPCFSWCMKFGKRCGLWRF